MTTAQRGDARRTALLESLDEILREQSLEEGTLDSINIAEISRRAGVTRSAFYFYFENKQAAVAALMEEMYDAAFAATGELSGDATPQDNIAATISGLFDAWESHQHVFRAMLDAKATSPAVRELWDNDRHSFIAPVAAMIEAERAGGRAPDGVDATSIAAVLLDLNDRMLERLALGGALTRPQIQAAVVEIWLRTIYGRTTP
ncbi:TetR/AcrR family transcriptional regulator [Nocardioides psychrotolerans]|uniref:TetR/AcrR family transcriptional regulator n=1 Tax=Nocardioides psychrotolerans TaxID=1005945 RepID=UPI0031384106